MANKTPPSDSQKVAPLFPAADESVRKKQKHKELSLVNINSVITHIPSKNIKITTDFFVNLFEFTIGFNTEYFVKLHNKDFTIGLLNTDKLENEQSIYIEVSNIDALWKEIKNNLKPYKHRELFKQEYGMKEFHVIIPETSTLLMVGEQENN